MDLKFQSSNLQNLSNFRKNVAVKKFKYIRFFGFWGHFEAFFEHEIAKQFEKVYSTLCLFAVECFHSAEKRKLRIFQ